jgi:hypothetical protein
MDSDTKMCAACRQSKPLGEFDNCSKTKDRKQNNCRTCKGKPAMAVFPDGTKQCNRCGEVKPIAKFKIIKLPKRRGICMSCTEPKKSFGFIDMTGWKFGKWTVLHRDSSKASKGGRVRWECECECGSRLVIDGGQLRSGTTKGCRKCHLKKLRALSFIVCRKGPYTRAFNCLVRAARGKGRMHTLTLNEYIGLVKPSICHWCDGPLSCTEYFVKNNPDACRAYCIDRLDNSVGYTLENCVPCCSKCNYDRGSLDVEEWTAVVNVRKRRLNIIPFDYPEVVIQFAGTSDLQKWGQSQGQQ